MIIPVMSVAPHTVTNEKAINERGALLMFLFSFIVTCVGCTQLTHLFISGERVADH